MGIKILSKISMDPQQQQAAQNLQKSLISGTEEISEWHKSKSENCITRYNNDMSGFSQCLLPYHKQYSKVAEVFQQKVNYVQLQMDECIKIHGKGQIVPCMEKAVVNVQDAVTGSMYE